MSIYEYDNRGEIKRKNLKREKWNRQIIKASDDGSCGLLPKKESEPERQTFIRRNNDKVIILGPEIISYYRSNPTIILDRSRKYADAIAYPNHYYEREFNIKRLSKSKKKKNIEINTI